MNRVAEIGQMRTLIQDLRYGLRQLRKTPAFTLTVLLTLALGIGANASIFTLVHALLLKNLPVTHPRSLIRLGDDNTCCILVGVNNKGDYTFFSTDTYHRFRQNLPEFEELAAMQAGFTYQPIIVRRQGEQASSVAGEFVSGNYFRTFGLRPQAGRLLTDDDDIEGAPPTAVMSYETWQRRYNGDPSVIGSSFFVNTKPVTVVGIAPRGFYGDRISSTPPDYYLPIETKPLLSSSPYVHNPEAFWLYVIGRVKPGVAMAPLQEKISAQLRQSFATNKNFSGDRGRTLLAKAHVVLTPGGAGIQSMQEQYGSQLHLLMWCAGLVLLIACANIANLLLVRGMGRRAEMSLRTALGAARARLIRQLLTESILLAGLGGIAGLAVAYAGTRLLLTLAFPQSSNVPIETSPSAVVVGFAMGLSLLTGILFGVAPAWMAARTQPVEALRSGTRTKSAAASPLQRGLVVLQAAVSLILLVGAGLFAQSLSKLENTDLHLDSRNRYILHFNPRSAGFATTQVEALYRLIEQRFHDVPGVLKVGLASYTPMEDDNYGMNVQVQGQPNKNIVASFVKANAEYFDSVGTRVVLGRGISTQDTANNPSVVVVNQSFVKQFFGNENPLGHRVGAPESPGAYEVVGVVRDTTYQNVRQKDRSMFFIPIMQRGGDKTPIEDDISLYAGAIVLETARPVDNMETLARTTLAGINPNLTLEKFQTFDQQIADTFSEERLISRLTMLFGGLALLLAAIGLYGLTAYNVVRRTAEIGIRMALGANRGWVITMVMRSALLQTALGLAIGIPVALMCVRFVESQLYDIHHANILVVGAAIVVLAAAACIAGLIPARRAASIEPAQALRNE
jgi:macrolide transport system ATP-binding/permease protein